MRKNTLWFTPRAEEGGLCKVQAPQKSEKKGELADLKVVDGPENKKRTAAS